MLAYYVECHMRQALKPILFDDHDKVSADAARTSIVAKAKRSEAAMPRPPQSAPTASSRHLVTSHLTRNTMAMNAHSDATFTLYP